VSPKGTLVLGVIGADIHNIGITILASALRTAGFHVINLGILVSQEDFVKAAIETAADAILVSSLCGHGELDCPGLRDKCIEAGLENILLYVGGNIVVGKHDWEPVAQKFRAMGFDRVYPPGTTPHRVIEDISADLSARTEART
jgi:methylaspartate mutase sigma subunit